MSRNSKGAKRNAQAKEMSRIRTSGGKGPSETTPQHGKKNAWWQKFKSYADFVSGPKKGGRVKQEDAMAPEAAVV